MSSTPKTTAFSRRNGEGAEDERPTILARIRRRFGQWENPLAPKTRFDPRILAEGIFPLTAEVATQPKTSARERAALWEALFGRIEAIANECGNPYSIQLELVASVAPGDSGRPQDSGLIQSPHSRVDPQLIFAIGQRSEYVN
jgi:hypothetical protein